MNAALRTVKVTRLLFFEIILAFNINAEFIFSISSFAHFISRVHLEQVQEKDARIEAFIEKLNMDWSSEVSFRKNLDQFFANNEVSENVQTLIWNSLEEKANGR